MVNGKVVIITGAAQGLGAAMARAMLAEGAMVAGCDIAAGTGLADADPGGQCSLFAACDITDTEAVRGFVATVIARFGRVDVLVNNAAILPPQGVSLPEMAEADWQRVLDVNLGGTLRMCAAVIPQMVAQQAGVVISMASVHASQSIPGFTPYAASKGAILAMTRQLAVEYGADNIRFNAISPGAIQTAMTQAILDSDPSGALSRSFAHMHALERIGQPEEVAATAVFLASDGAGFITGAEIMVDGGLIRTTRLEMARPGGERHADHTA